MFENRWENIYKKHRRAMNSFTYLIIATLINEFMDRHQDKEYRNIKVLELGFGSGANLLFLAELGCQVYGIDISETAVNYAKDLFKQKEQYGLFFVSNFAPLNFQSAFFDIIIDRGVLVCADKELYKTTIKETYRLLKPFGKLLLTPFSELNHNTIAINNNDDSVYVGKSTPQLQFHTYNINQILKILKQTGFETFFLRRNDRIDYIINNQQISGEKVISNYDIISRKVTL